MKHSSSYYREQAIRLRAVAEKEVDQAKRHIFEATARDYDEVAQDLDSGAIIIRHPELCVEKPVPAPASPDNSDQRLITRGRP